VTKYAFEMIDIFNPTRLESEFEGMEMQLFGHSPDSANEWDFYPEESQGERKGVVLFGFTGSCEFGLLIRWGRSTGLEPCLHRFV
jgi:hypothetical protein